MGDDEISQIPSMRNILLLRRLPTSKVNESYIFFCKNFLKCVVGTQKFNRGFKQGLKISQIASPSDEALALLLLQNSEFRWMMEYQKRSNGEMVKKKDDLVATLYTTAGKNKDVKGFTKKYGGWKEDGIKRFNELQHLVKQDRSFHGEWFDLIVKERLKSVGEEDGGGNDKTTGTYIKAANDLGFEEAIANQAKKRASLNDDNWEKEYDDLEEEEEYDVVNEAHV